MRERPEAMRKRNMAAVRPLRDWAKTKDRSGTTRCGEGPPPLSARRLVHELGGIDVRHGLHDGEGILRLLHRLAVELAAVGLVVLLADGELTRGRVHGQAEKSLGDLLRVRAVGLLDRLREELHTDVALDSP